MKTYLSSTSVWRIVFLTISFCLQTEKESNNQRSGKAKKRKLDGKDESSDESDDERRKENIFLRNHKNKLQKTELYDLWSPNNEKGKLKG